MKTLILVAKIVDGLVSLTLHVAGIVYLLKGQWVAGSVILGMVSLWQMGCIAGNVFKKYAEEK